MELITDPDQETTDPVVLMWGIRLDGRHAMAIGDTRTLHQWFKLALDNQLMHSHTIEYFRLTEEEIQNHYVIPNL
jgi:hypothetical protein